MSQTLPTANFSGFANARFGGAVVVGTERNSFAPASQLEKVALASAKFMYSDRQTHLFNTWNINTVQQLRRICKRMGVDLKGVVRKADIIHHMICHTKL